MEGRHHLGNLVVTSLPGWLDVTHEIAADSPPFTLGRADGAGVLQFSAAAYESGLLPNITVEVLKDLLTDFSRSRELGRGFDLVSREQPTLIYGRSFNFGSQFLRAWYCSNGRDIVLVTYVCEKGYETTEVGDCEAMVGVLRFVD